MSVTTNSLSEERRSRRRSFLSFRPVVRVELIQCETVREMNACLLEIGRTGLSVELIEPISPGTPVSVFLDSLPVLGIVKVSGVVKWVEPLDLKDSCGECKFRIGLRLAELLPDVDLIPSQNNGSSQLPPVPAMSPPTGDAVSNPKILVDKRSFFRLKRTLPIRLHVRDQGNKRGSPRGGYDIIAYDINEGGILTGILVPDRAILHDLMVNMREAKLEIRFIEQAVVLKVKVKPVWFKSQDDPIDPRISCGFQFIGLQQSDKIIIGDYIKREKNKTIVDRLKTFPLFVGGEDVDTWDYEYFPYAEKMILDFKATYRMIVHMKKGEKPTGYEDYIFARYCVGDAEINRRAMEAAHKASLAFRLFPIEARKKILIDIRDILVSNKEKLIDLLVVEGHTRKLAEWEFLGMERSIQTSTLDFFVKEIWKEIRNGDERIVLARKADGVVCIVPPKNAPCSNSFLGILSFLPGNAVVVKPPLKMPLSTIFLWRNVVQSALKMNHAPDGCVNIVVGNSSLFMDQWLDSPLVNDILYFGVSGTGLEIGKQAYAKGKKPILELSGNDMVFIWKDADLTKAVSSTLDAFLGSTQICMVPKNVLVHEDIFDRFLEMFTIEVRKLRVGLPSSEDCYLSPVIKIKEFSDFMEDALQRGAQLICGGRRVDHTGELAKNGAFLEPSVLRFDSEETARGSRVILEENFFPLLPVVKISGASDEEVFSRMVSFSNENRYGLRTSVWIKSKIFLDRFIRELDNTGLLRINARHVEFSPYTSSHGGTRLSGGPYGEMNYIWQKTSHLQGISYRDSTELPPSGI